MRNIVAASMLALSGCDCSSNLQARTRPDLQATQDASTKVDESTAEDERHVEAADGGSMPDECTGRVGLTRGEMAAQFMECLELSPPTCKPETTNSCCIPIINATSEREINSIRALCKFGIFDPNLIDIFDASDRLSSAQFANIATHILGLKLDISDSDFWYEPAYDALEKAGLLPEGERDCPSGPPSDEFIRRIIAACRAL